MKRREEWRPVLEAEVTRWKAKSYLELQDALTDEQVYEIQFGGRNHQVEVSILENKATFVHVIVSVDDGTLPASLSPLSESFIKHRS